ncbi:enoyl-CoA hydratase-related protein [Streptomyces sp. NPDC056987]|uniref:enoyl-CoA hydratase-related protein n=1 Tax=Streptomyces sp. NPDC056987 TaxID=3345988 RepID=UPI003624E9EA
MGAGGDEFAGEPAKTWKIRRPPGVVVSISTGPAGERGRQRLPLTLTSGFSAEVRTENTVGVIVFDSADPDYFSAHVEMADTTVLEQVLQDGTLNFTEELHESYRTLPQVTIAKVAGRARGGRIEFIAALDLRFAALEKRCSRKMR